MTSKDAFFLACLVMIIALALSIGLIIGSEYL